MASTATPTSTSTQASGVQPAASSQKDVSNKTTMKNTGSAKMTEKGRKESPVDMGRRQPSKAWTSGSNPITQRGPTPSQANGNTSQSKPPTGPKTNAQKEVGLSDKHGHDRLRYILAASVGLSVIFTTRVGDKFEGLFAGSVTTTNGTKITLKMTRKLQNNANQINGIAAREAALVGTSPEHAMTFDFKDMADLAIPDFSLPEAARHVNGVNSSFQTDTDISGSTVRGQRTLQKWQPEGSEDTGMSLDSGPAVQWDQFETHNQMFGGKSTYDENLYTTEIDRKAPGYKQREAEAARIAREIEGLASDNPHVREERNQSNEQDYGDEESKYSGVQRGDQAVPTLPPTGSNKYTPPARRAPTANPTVAGAPFDSAIISAQLSKPDGPKAVPPKSPVEASLPSNGSAIEPEQTKAIQNGQPVADATNKPRPINTTLSPQTKPHTENPTDDVEVKVLGEFRQFANFERARIAEHKRAQATHDRKAKLNELLRFSTTFKLKTPIPEDLVGILAKDPVKQTAIISKAKKESEDAKSSTSAAPVPAPVPSTTAAPAAPPPAAASLSAKLTSVAKFDASQIPPPIPDRATLARGRGGYLSTSTRGERAPQPGAQFAGRGAPTFTQRAGGPQERKPQAASVPSNEGRAPPTGPLADQVGIASPPLGQIQTPTSAISTKMNARAMEFRPTAPAFNPSASSNAPSSPASVQRANSVSRAASPSSFFGARKPKVPSERSSVSSAFNPIQRMRQEVLQAKKTNDKSGEATKDYAHNGGIPNAYHTGPVWLVKDENKDKTYLSAFERPGNLSSPAQTRSASAHHHAYQGQMPNVANGTPSQLSTPQHGQHASHHYGHQFDDHRLHIQGGSPQVFASPGMPSRQMSNFSSPMAHQAQLAYNQPPYYGTPGAQMPMPMRTFPNTPGMMHAQPGQMAAPLMVQQASSGPYMTVPQGYSQMPMYSPNQNHVYPQQNGYPSPSRAPMMMQQGSQQGHPGGQQVMYGMPGQAGPMMYGQQGGMMRGSYGGLHQPHHMQQRAMSTGYGQKGMPQSMQQNQGAPSNAPQQPAAYAQLDMGSEDAK